MSSDTLRLDFFDLSDQRDGLALVAEEAALILDCVLADLGAARDAVATLLHRWPGSVLPAR
jgi:hypothetical protein